MQAWLLAVILGAPFELAVLFVLAGLVIKLLVSIMRLCIKPPAPVMQDVTQLPVAPELNCLQSMLDGPTGKRWTMMPCLSDHIVILTSHIVGLFGAYTGCGGAAIEHQRLLRAAHAAAAPRRELARRQAVELEEAAAVPGGDGG